jgi:hypothetical protein
MCDPSRLPLPVPTNKSKQSLSGARRIRLLHVSVIVAIDRATTYWLFRRRVNPRRHLIMRLVRDSQTSIVLPFEQECVWKESIEWSCAVYLVDFRGRQLDAHGGRKKFDVLDRLNAHDWEDVKTWVD